MFKLTSDQLLANLEERISLLATKRERLNEEIENLLSKKEKLMRKKKEEDPSDTFQN